MDIIATLIATIALISDLVESGFKRLAGEKDSGNTIPGIGGVFDLMDSLILTLPMGVIMIREFVLF
jgi:phosphatidate cytidylyltransferase